MKLTHTKLFGILAALSLFFTACTPTTEPETPSNNKTEETDPAKIDDGADITIDGRTLDDWAFHTISLAEYGNKNVVVTLSADMKVYNLSDKDITLKWNITASGYPTVASETFEPGTSKWVKVSGSNANPAEIDDEAMVYLDKYGVDAENLVIKIKNLKCTVKATTIQEPENYYLWTADNVPSIKDTYADQFDYIGIACEYDVTWKTPRITELASDDVCNGLKKHANTISMGNEFKPESFFGYQWTGAKSTLVDFKASNGLTIKVPSTLNYSTVDNCLAQCKKHGLKMRGHVLAWHAQTPEAFFTVNYAAAEYESENQNTITNRVSKEVMQARLEWYIKTVLTHVANWEAANNNGEHIIWAWDVFNETVADDANDTNWVRGSTSQTKDRPPAAPAVNPGPCGSRWYQVYEDTDFIVDAFIFANAYAPADVKLCYNDYNEYMGNKTTGILKLINLVKNASPKTVNGVSVSPRLDVMGMQSHVGVSWPGVSGYESALKKYLELVDVHVTEFDVSATTSAESVNAYKDYFTMFQKYGNKYNGAHKIENVTIWGINNKTSWIYKNDVKYPLIFSEYKTMPSFWAVIEAHKE